MRRIFSSFPILFACAASFAAGLPPKVETPTTTGWFWVDPATGALTPLEKAKPAVEGNSYRYRIYLPGLTSTVAIPYAAKQVFAIRLFGPPDLEHERKQHSLLEALSVEKAGRYATRKYFPVEITTYGEVTTLPNQKRPSLTFLFTTTAPLPPGEYAFSGVGLLTGCPGPCVGQASAFSVVAGVTSSAPGQGVSKTPVQAAEPPVSDQLGRLKKLKELHDGGLITDADYENKKAEILKGM